MHTSNNKIMLNDYINDIWGCGFFSEDNLINSVTQQSSQRSGTKQSLNTKNKSAPYQATNGKVLMIRNRPGGKNQ